MQWVFSAHGAGTTATFGRLRISPYPGWGCPLSLEKADGKSSKGLRPLAFPERLSRRSRSSVLTLCHSGNGRLSVPSVCCSLIWFPCFVNDIETGFEVRAILLHCDSIPSVSFELRWERVSRTPNSILTFVAKNTETKYGHSLLSSVALPFPLWHRAKRRSGSDDLITPGMQGAHPLPLFPAAFYGESGAPPG